MEVVQLLIDVRNHILDELKFQLEKAQDQMLQYADRKRREVTYEVGDQVYLKIQSYRLRSFAKQINQKLSPRYYGPFEVIGRIGTRSIQAALAT